MKDETLSTDSTHKKLVPSFSVSNFKENNNSKITNKLISFSVLSKYFPKK